MQQYTLTDLAYDHGALEPYSRFAHVSHRN